MKSYLLALVVLGGASLACASSPGSEPVALPEMKAVGTWHSALVSHVLPEYPMELRRCSETGRVSLDITVDQQGRVRAIHVLDSDNNALSEAARAAVRQWRFVADRDPSRATRRATVTFSFELAERA